MNDLIVCVINQILKRLNHSKYLFYLGLQRLFQIIIQWRFQTLVKTKSRKTEENSKWKVPKAQTQQTNTYS